MSWNSEARALWRDTMARVGAHAERARGSAVRLLVAFGLMAPAAFMMAGDRYDARRAVALQPAATAGNASGVDVANAAWTEEMKERELAYITAGFARQFNIPLPLAETIKDAAVEYDIDPQIAFGLVRAESSFRTRAVSPAGAVGLAQLLPSTARWIAPGTTRADLMNPETNVRVGFKYLRYLVDKYEGDEKLALTAYNRGQGTVDRLLRQGRNPDNGYVEMVLNGKSQRHTALMNQRFGRRS
jgi:soluble lytic murein transglycosylase-like protein